MGRPKKVNNTFFRFTLLDQWTKFVQLTSYKTGKHLISKKNEGGYLTIGALILSPLWGG